MGTNCASHVANIFLHVYYEKLFISKLIEEDDNEYLAILGTIFRCQDDLMTFGKHMVNNKFITNIYPKYMIIKNTNISANQVTYLDLAIKSINNKFYFKSYDKRCGFSFHIINYPKFMKQHSCQCCIWSIYLSVNSF